jgi:hypothetical protein
MVMVLLETIELSQLRVNAWLAGGFMSVAQVCYQRHASDKVPRCAPIRRLLGVRSLM